MSKSDNIFVRSQQRAKNKSKFSVADLEPTVDDQLTRLEEDIRRLREFERTSEAVPLDEVKAWVESWGTANELPRPKPRKIT